MGQAALCAEKVQCATRRVREGGERKDTGRGDSGEWLFWGGREGGQGGQKIESVVKPLERAAAAAARKKRRGNQRRVRKV